MYWRVLGLVAGTTATLLMLGLSAGLACLGSENEEEIQLKESLLLSSPEMSALAGIATAENKCNGDFTRCYSADDAGCVAWNSYLNKYGALCQNPAGRCVPVGSGNCVSATPAFIKNASATPVPTVTSTPQPSGAATPPPTPIPSGTPEPNIVVTEQVDQGAITWYGGPPTSQEVLQYGGFAIVAIAADDVTGVGVMDDPLIPVIAVAVVLIAAYSTYYYYYVVPKGSAVSIPMPYYFQSTTYAQSTTEVKVKVTVAPKSKKPRPWCLVRCRYLVASCQQPVGYGEGTSLDYACATARAVAYLYPPAGCSPPRERIKWCTVINSGY